MREVPVVQNDRLPIARTEFSVDAFHFGKDGLRMFGVRIDRRPRWRGDLKEREAADILRVSLEEKLDALETLRNAFDVIEAVNAKRHLPCRDAKPIERCAICLLFPFCDAGEGNRDRKRFDERLMVVTKNREMFEIDARLDFTRDGIEEIVAVLLRLESHDIGAEHTLKNFFSPRTDRKLRIGAAFLDQGGYEREVIILDEDERPLDTVNFIENSFGKETVDFAVLGPVFFAEYRPYVRHVAQRPERFVGKAVIITFHLFAREPGELQRVLGLVMRDANFVVRVDDELVGFTRPVRDPYAAGCLHDRFERRYDTSRGNRPFNAVLAARIHIRFSIGYDEYGPVFYVRLNKFFEPFGSPWRVEFFESHARLLTCRKARLPKATRHLCDFIRDREEHIASRTTILHCFTTSYRSNRFCQLGERLEEHPPDEREYSHRDQNSLQEKTNEIVAPNIPNRRADIARVLNRGKRSDSSALAVLYRRREHIKCFGSALCKHTFRLRCVHDRGDEGCVDDIGRILRTRRDDARAVKDRESGEPLIPDESVDGVRYRTRRVVFKHRQDGCGETLGENVGTGLTARGECRLFL